MAPAPAEGHRVAPAAALSASGVFLRGVLFSSSVGNKGGVLVSKLSSSRLHRSAFITMGGEKYSFVLQVKRLRPGGSAGIVLVLGQAPSWMLGMALEQ